MMKKTIYKTMYKKIIAIITTLSFVFSFIVSQPLQAVVERQKELKDFKKIFDSFVLPAMVGRVTDASSQDQAAQAAKADGPLVINIQDLHCHPEVQKNISRILSLL